MRKRVLSETKFKHATPGWTEPNLTDKRFNLTPNGLHIEAPKGSASINGAGVHTRNGDEIVLYFQVGKKKQGQLRFGFAGGTESAIVTLDFAKRIVTLNTSDWTMPKPQGKAPFTLSKHDAFGYWPTRSFRASESVAEAYVSLYRARGGTRI